MKTEPKTFPATNERLRDVKAYIEQNYSEELRLEELAAMLGMAPSAFSRYFRNTTGQRLCDFITLTRIRHVEQLLMETREPIKDICYSNGFNTLSNFNRLFKKTKGCTPTEYRERVKS